MTKPADRPETSAQPRAKEVPAPGAERAEGHVATRESAPQAPVSQAPAPKSAPAPRAPKPQSAAPQTSHGADVPVLAASPSEPGRSGGAVSAEARPRHSAKRPENAPASADTKGADVSFAGREPRPASDQPAALAVAKHESAEKSTASKPARSDDAAAQTPVPAEGRPASSAQPAEGGAPSADNAGVSGDEKPAKARPRRRSRTPLPTDRAELAKLGVEMTPEVTAAIEAMPRRRRGRPTNEELQARKVLEDAIRDAERRKAGAPQDKAGAPAPERPASDARPAQDAPAAASGTPTQGRPEGGDTAQAERRGDAGPSGSQPAQAPREEGGYQRRNHRRQDGAAFVPRHQRNQQRQANAQQGGRNDRTDRAQGNQNQGGGQNQGRQNRPQDGRNDRFDRRQQRRDNRNNREALAPKANREELAELKVAELRTKATDLGVDGAAALKKPELVEAVYGALVKQEGFFDCAGVLDLMPEGYGFIRTKGYLPSEGDVYVGAPIIRSNGLRRGDWLVGIGHASRPNDKYPALAKLESVNGRPAEEMRNRPRFADLTPVFPDERLRMEHGRDSILGRCVDLVAPIGKGQRGLIVSPPKAGKTTVLKKIAESIAANNPEVHLICLLVDERPEEVTDMQRSIKGEVVASTFDMPCDNHIALSELVIERAKRLVELGQDVVILLDSITRLARAYNLAQPASGRILSGGVDSTALYPPKRFLGAARNIEGGGSLTILASALVETGSKMDEVIFEEFKGTGNMELKLDRDLADRRIFPAIDPVASGTRKEELLLEPGIAPFVWGIRRILANMNNNERAMASLIKSLKATATNEEFLIRSAKKAQNQEIGAELQ